MSPVLNEEPRDWWKLVFMTIVCGFVVVAAVVWLTHR